MHAEQRDLITAPSPRALDIASAVDDAIDGLADRRPETFDGDDSKMREWTRRLTSALDSDLHAAPSDVIEGAHLVATERQGRIQFPELVAAILRARDERERTQVRREPFPRRPDMYASADVAMARQRVIGRLWEEINARLRSGRPMSADEAEDFAQREWRAAGVGIGRVPLDRPAPPWVPKRAPEPNGGRR